MTPGWCACGHQWRAHVYENTVNYWTDYVGACRLMCCECRAYDTTPPASAHPERVNGTPHRGSAT